MTAVVVHTEVEAAIRDHAPVVVLESAVLTTGLPDLPWADGWDRESLARAVPDWDPDAPLASQLQHRMERAVRDHGAIPCTTALINGRLHLGIDDRTAKTLMQEGVGNKVASTSLAIGMTPAGIRAWPDPSVATHGPTARSDAATSNGGSRMWPC